MKKRIRSMAGAAASGLAFRGRGSDRGGAKITAERVDRTRVGAQVSSLSASYRPCV